MRVVVLIITSPALAPAHAWTGVVFVSGVLFPGHHSLYSWLYSGFREVYVLVLLLRTTIYDYALRMPFVRNACVHERRRIDSSRSSRMPQDDAVGGASLLLLRRLLLFSEGF